MMKLDLVDNEPQDLMNALNDVVKIGGLDAAERLLPVAVKLREAMKQEEKED